MIVRPFKPSGQLRREALRAYLHGLRIRLLLLCGYGVIVVGPARSGKTFLLDRTLPGQVVCPDMKALLSTGKPVPFDMAKVPEGMFAIDEPQGFDDWSLRRAFPSLRSRRVAVTVQSLQLLRRLRLDELFEQRFVIVYLGHRADYQREVGG